MMKPLGEYLEPEFGEGELHTCFRIWVRNQDAMSPALRDRISRQSEGIWNQFSVTVDGILMRSDND